MLKLPQRHMAMSLLPLGLWVYCSLFLKHHSQLSLTFPGLIPTDSARLNSNTTNTETSSLTPVIPDVAGFRAPTCMSPMKACITLSHMCLITAHQTTGLGRTGIYLVLYCIPLPGTVKGMERELDTRLLKE